MIGFEFRFTSGTYHATPWQRHVNEADVEWPPSPWRVLRALIATWYRKAGYSLYPESTFREIIEVLCTELPVYQLPQVTHSNSRHYMPAGSNTSLVFDGFLRIDSKDSIRMAWPNLVLSKDQLSVLEFLTSRLSYLGRAESWVEATVIQDPFKVNSEPMDTAEQGFYHEPVSVLVPMSPMEYQEWIATQVSGSTYASSRRRLSAEAGPPSELFGALMVDTNDLEAQGRVQPPGSRWVVYHRPILSLRKTQHVLKSAESHNDVRAARFVLTSKPLPSVHDTLDVAEVLHMALVDKCGDDVPVVISGREEDGSVSTRGHRHLFILPEDDNGDGYIDHILLIAPDPLESRVREAIGRIKQLTTPTWWPGPKREWEVFLEGFFDPLKSPARNLGTGSVVGLARIWQSSTPYLRPWHVKKHGRFGSEEQIRRELQMRGMPEPIRVVPLKHIEAAGRHVSPAKFRKLRRGKSQRLPDTLGSFWQIEFEQPILGPVCLGSNCHFGLGAFVPRSE